MFVTFRKPYERTPRQCERRKTRNCPEAQRRIRGMVLDQTEAIRPPRHAMQTEAQGNAGDMNSVKRRYATTYVCRCAAYAAEQMWGV